MITHIVCFKLKDRSPQSVNEAREKLANMEGKIPQLLHLEVGADILHTERSYDIALYAKFNSLADLDAYVVHPVHQEVVKYMQEAAEARVAVDFES